MKINPKKILIYLAFAFGLSWTLAGVFYLLGGRWDGLAAVIVGVVYMFGPFSAVLLTQKLIGRDTWKNTLRLNFRFNRWFVVAWLLPALLAVAALGVALLFPNVSFSPDASGFFARYRDILPPADYARIRSQQASLPLPPFWLTLLSGLAAGITVNPVAAYGEELGWRGFLFDELKPLGFWRPALLTGAIWGLWHAPLIIQGHDYAQHPVAGVFMMIAWCTLLSPIFFLIRLKSKSVPAAAILHGSLNGTAGIAMLFVAGGTDLTIGLQGLAGFIVLAAVDLAIFVFLKVKPPPETAPVPGRAPSAP